MADEAPNQSDKTLPVTPSPTDQTVVGGSTAPGDEQVLSSFGNYEILDEIARGGVGLVYKARQRGLNRIVALKILLSGMRASAEQVQRFMHEARSAARLQHANIVPIHDFGVTDGQHFFTMDYVEGESLADVIARGPIQPREAIEIVKQVADALHYAHQQGVVHRDIKPGNILLDRQGRVKVTDFGLAKEVSNEQMSLTMTGQVMGTPRYMSPEQAAGKTAQADARSDIFSLGVTLYEMLTGRPAFAGESVVEMLQQVLQADPPPPCKLNNKVHRDIETICLKAIEKTPDRRYQNALDMTQDIDRFLAGEPIEAKPVGVLNRWGRRLHKHYKGILIYGVLLFLTVNGIMLALHARPSALHLKLTTRGAKAWLDGVPLTAEELASSKSFKAGRHRLRVEAEPLFVPQESNFVTDPGESRAMSVTLVRRSGVVTVATDPADAGVTLLGENGYKATLQGPTVKQELPTGQYSVYAHKENYLERWVDFAVEHGRTNAFQFSLLSIRLWSAATSGNILSVPVVGDFNGDHSPDVVVGDDDGHIYCYSGRNGVPIWVFAAEDAVQAPLSKADLNGDGFPDIVVGGTDHRLYCLNGKDGQPLWVFPTKGPIRGPALLRDVTGDGVPDVFVGSEDSNLYAVDGRSGKQLWKFTTQGSIHSCLAWCQEGPDSAILVGGTDRVLACVRARDGQLLWKVSVGEALYFPPRLEDLEQNGKLVALLPTPKAPGDARTCTPVTLAEHKVLPAGDSFPLWIDLDGNGHKCKLLVTAQGTTCLTADGATRWHTAYIAATPYFADVTGDGVRDLIFNNGPDQLICLSGKDGQPVGRVTLEAGVGRGFSLEDVDQDGVPDLVVGAGRRLDCFSWVGGRQHWVAHADAYYDAPLVAADGRVFTKTSGGEIACYDPQHPQPLWRVPTSEQPSPYPALAAGGGLVVDADPATRRLAAFRSASGELAWSVRLPGATNTAVGSPSVLGDVVVIGDGDAGVHCFALQDGALRWQQSFPKVTGRASSDGERLYFGDGNQTLHCLSLRDGASRWSFPVSDPFPSPPALVDVNGDGIKDAVALCDNGYIYALNGVDGKSLWELQFTGQRSRTRHRLVLADLDHDGFPEGLVCSLAGNVVCLDLKVGKPKWIVPLRERVMGEVAVADVDGDGVPDVLVGTMERRLHAVSGTGQGVLWNYELGAQVRYSAPLILPPAKPGEPPLVLVGTGPPDNGLYCLSASAPRRGQDLWTSLWRGLTEVAGKN